MSALDMQNRQFSEVNAAIATSFADVGLPIELDGNFKEVCFEVENTGVDLTDFSLMVKAHPLGTYVNWITGVTWATAAGLVRFKSANVNTLATGAKATVSCYIPTGSHIKFQAKCGSSTTSVTVRGTAWR